MKILKVSVYCQIAFQKLCEIYRASSRKESANHEEHLCQNYIMSLCVSANLTGQTLYHL